MCTMYNIDVWNILLQVYNVYEDMNMIMWEEMQESIYIYTYIYIYIYIYIYSGML